MIAYQTKTSKLTGSSDREIYKKSNRILNYFIKKTKRRPYIKSDYFKKRKVFLELFNKHLIQKPSRQRISRLKYLPPALELITNSRNKPEFKVNPNNGNEILYRFSGKTTSNDLFFVQIKENTKSKKLYFMSVFSAKE